MNVIKQRIRNKAGKHVGMMVALKNDDKVCVGWSICHLGKDQYNKEMADQIAINRALVGFNTCLPRFATEQYAEFCKRAQKYFTNPNPLPKRKWVKKNKQTQPA